jgi:polysaccharide export outer membrane protein
MLHKLIVALCITILVVSLPTMLLGQQQQPISPSASPTSPKAPPSASSMAQRDTSGPPSDAGGPPPDAEAHSVDSNAPGQRYPRYKISADDVMELHFPLSPEYDQSVTVQPDGYISLIGANSIHVQGLSVPELVDAVKTAYAKILHDPIISVDLTDFQKPFFVVSGQVNKPGQYDLRSDITVSEAIAIAGGFAPTAKTQVFLYHRVSSGWMEVKQLKLKDILHGKNVDEDAMMHPGDMIFVPEKFITNFRKYVPYSFGIYATPTPAWF